MGRPGGKIGKRIVKKERDKRESVDAFLKQITRLVPTIDDEALSQYGHIAALDCDRGNRCRFLALVAVGKPSARAISWLGQLCSRVELGDLANECLIATEPRDSRSFGPLRPVQILGRVIKT